MKVGNVGGEGVRWVRWMLIGMLGLAGQVRHWGGERSDRDSTFVMGMAEEMMVGLNRNDAKVALGAWIRMMFESLSDTNQAAFEILDRQSLNLAMEEKRLGGAMVTTEHALELLSRVKMDRLMLGIQQGRRDEEYYLLVQATGAVRKLADLRGGTLLVLEHPRASLAVIWLETELLREGGGRLRDHFGKVEKKPKLANVVLPVFFRSAEACLTTRRGFETMVELNPQMKERVRVLKASPALIPVAFLVREGVPEWAHEMMTRRLGEVRATTSGQQVLTLFQSEGVEDAPLESLEGSLGWVREWKRLLAEGASKGSWVEVGEAGGGH